MKTNAEQSALTFCNVVGVEQTYTLRNATVAAAPVGVSRPEEAGVFQFGFQNNGQWVMEAVPFSDTLSSNLTLQTYELNLSKNTDPALSTLSTTTNQITTLTGIPLSSFNFLNSKDYLCYDQRFRNNKWTCWSMLVWIIWLMSKN